MKKTLFNFLLASSLGSLLYSCANPGYPTGGPKDEESPVVLKTVPANNAVNFKDNKITIHFNEFVQLKEMNEKFMISPPQKKKPTVKLKGKSILIQLNDTLKKNTTYTMDFADAIVDNNEGNPLGNFQYSFSTGPQQDTLRIMGVVNDAYNGRPVENAYVLIYDDTRDSIPLQQKASYVARTDTAGHFSIINIPQKTYRILAITDNNRDFIFNSPVEPVAFLDSLITPYAKYEESIDTLKKDSVMLRGYTLFSPADLHLRMFKEKDKQLYLTKYDRPRREKLEFQFNRDRTDVLHIDFLEVEESKNWYILEGNATNDTLNYWITDSMIYKRDTLMAELQYLKTDSLGQLVTVKDTVKLNFKPAKKAKMTKKEKKKITIESPSLGFKADIKSTHDLNKDLELFFDEPVKDYQKKMIHLFLLQDTLELEQNFSFTQDSLELRKYRISNKWKSEEKYKLQIDSAAFTSVYGLNNKAYEKKFKAQEQEYYGKIILNISNVKNPLIVQVVKGNDKEPLIQSKRINSDQKVEFSYLYPDTYVVKVIYDRNNNGKWDTGNYVEKIQPEEVFYFGKPLKIRSNWDVEENWNLP